MINIISLSHSLRHTPTGGTVTIEASTDQSSAKNLRILVKDNGEGIAPEDVPFIFDRFWRKDKSRSKRTHSGLGLAITKQLIHAHGGSIEVESVIGKGSTFIIELPKHLLKKDYPHSITVLSGLSINLLYNLDRCCQLIAGCGPWQQYFTDHIVQ